MLHLRHVATGHWSCAIPAVLLWVSVGLNAIAAQESGDSRLSEMTERVKALSLRKSGTGDPIFVQRQALLRYSAPDSTTTDGALWVWMSDGRPVALTSVFLDARPDFRWNYECVSLANEPLTVKSPRGWSWSPKDSGQQWQSIPDVVPATTARARLVQMRGIARTFSSHHDLDGSRVEHRLLPQPVLRYGDDAEGIVDGALFLFTSGTNPEVVVRLEAIEKPQRWRVAFSRLTAAKAVVTRGQKLLWQGKRVKSWNWREPYFSHYGPDE